MATRLLQGNILGGPVESLLETRNFTRHLSQRLSQDIITDEV